MDKLQFHKSFKLQGASFKDVESLLTFSESISIDIFSFLKEWFNKESYVKVKTSGSTGTPKVIKLQKKHMINSAKATGDFFNLNENTTALLCMPSNFIAGKMMFVRALTLGWRLTFVQPSSNPLQFIEEEYDFCAMVPLQVNNSLKDLHKIKKLIVGGGVVSNELLNKLQSIKTEIFATYGMTETITHIAIKKLNKLSLKNIIDDIPISVENSLYKILPNIKITTDSRGCLVINAPKISNEIIITNDLVELVTKTEFKWLGRYDSIINSGGIKLIPEQIEEKLRAIISEPFFLAGIPDTVLGEKLVLVIKYQSIKVEKFKSLLFQKINELQTLLEYETPKEIYCVEHFIKHPQEKLIEQQL